MCFPVESCLFCVNLDAATKIIGFIYTVVSAGLMVLFGVPLVAPLVALRARLPTERLLLYGGLALSSAALCVASCVLIYAAYRNIPRLLRVWVVPAWCTAVPLALICVTGMVTVSFRVPDLRAAASESIVISAYFTHALLLYCCALVVDSRRVQMMQESSNQANKRLLYPIMYNMHSV